MKNKYLYGCISHNQYVYTLYYAKDDIYSNHREEFYNVSLFKKCPPDMPIIRYDLSNYNDISNFIKNNYACNEVMTVSAYERSWKMLNLDEYIEKLRENNIIVQTTKEVMKDFNQIYDY